MRTRRFALVTMGAVVVLSGFVASHRLSAQDQPQPPKKKDEFPKFEDVTDGYEPGKTGLYTVYRKKNHVLLEVPEGLLGRVFLLATSISGGTTLAGYQWSDFPAAWERNDKKLVLIDREVRYKFDETRDETKPLAEVVRRTYSDRVLKAMPIITLHGSNPVIDMNDLLGNNAAVFFGPLGGSLDPQVQTIAKLKVFPKNMEVALTMPERGEGQLTTLYYSFSELPDPRGDSYRPRAADDRVGYFLTAMKDFTDDHASGDRFVRFVNRWDLKKADPSLAVSPPKKPIVFYIEKTVPIRYRRWVQEGILEWNKAFEKCGFSDAILVRQQTEDNEFASYDPEDVQYNFFRWITSERSFAMGPSRVNPYTGQILDADIIFDDSMARYFLKDYELLIRQAPGKLFFSPELQQLLASDPERWPMAHVPADLARALGEPTSVYQTPDRAIGSCGYGEGIAHELGLAAIAGIALPAKQGGAAGNEWPEEFIGQVIKETVMHEVGHTLGLRHNFKASSWRPLSEINGKDLPEATSGSVMDYNAVNIRTKQGTPQGKYATSTIGPYDYWAIEYGYKPSGNEKADLEKIAARVAENGLAYGTDEDASGPDPLINRWDLGQDPLEFAKERLELATSLEKDLVDRLVKNGEGYQDVRKGYMALMYEKAHGGVLASRFVGGQLTNRDHKGDPNGREPIQPVAAAKQREALKFVCEKIFSDETWKTPPDLVRKLAVGRWSHWGTGDWAEDPAFPIYDQILNAQRWSLFGLLNPKTLQRVVDQETRVGESDDVLTLPELFETLDGSIFAELDNKQAQGPFTARKPFISTVRRNLQRTYAGELIAMSLGKGSTPQEVRTLSWYRAKQLAARIAATQKAVEGKLDAYSAAHLEETRTRLEKAIEASYQNVK